MASDPFLQGDDIHLDLSGCPSLQPKPTMDSTFEDDRFAPLTGTGGVAARDLKAFLEEQSQRAQGPNQVHLGRETVGTLSHDAQGWACTFAFQGTRHVSRGKTSDDAAMAAARFILNFQPAIRELDVEEERVCELLASSGRAVEAAERYITRAIPRAGELGPKVLTDPAYAETCDKAVFFAWSRSRNDYSLSDRDFPKYLRRFARHKRLTLALCDSAYSAYQDELSRADQAAHSAPPQEREPDASDIEDMSDAQVDAAYKGVARELAQSYRR
jgi:hypothetical protein